MIDWHFDRVQGFSSLSPFLFISFHFGKVKFHIRDSRNSRSLATQNVTDTRKPSNFQSEKRERCWWWDRIFLSSHFSCLSVSFIHFQLSFSLPSSSIWCNVTTCLSLSSSHLTWVLHLHHSSFLSRERKRTENCLSHSRDPWRRREDHLLSFFFLVSQSVNPSISHPSIRPCQSQSERRNDWRWHFSTSLWSETDRQEETGCPLSVSIYCPDWQHLFPRRERTWQEPRTLLFSAWLWLTDTPKRETSCSWIFDEEDSNKRLLKTHSRYFDGEKRIRLDERRRDMTWHRKRWDRKGEQQQTTTSGGVLEVLVVDSFEVCTSKQSLKYTDNHIPLLTFHPLGTVLLSSWHFVSWLAASFLIMIKCEVIGCCCKENVLRMCLERADTHTHSQRGRQTRTWCEWLETNNQKDAWIFCECSKRESASVVFLSDCSFLKLILDSCSQKSS